MLPRVQAAHLQAASPLFSVIPPEIRNLIFRFALHGYPDRTKGYYPGNAFYYRPGYEHDRRIDTALLLTCRRIYDETRLLPVIENERVFWYDRGPPGSSADPAKYFRRMAEEQQDVVDCVHFFTQQYLLQGRFLGSCAITEMRPRKLKITTRESDWWWFELNQSLVLKDKWTNNITLLKRLKEFEMELETVERDEDQVCIQYSVYH